LQVGSRPGLPTIEALELKALAAFDIDPSEAGNFVLRRGGRRARRGARAGTSAATHSQLTG
jgi:hypothetical protein